MLSKVKSAIGVNIGVNSIKLIELTKEDRSFNVSNSALVDIKQGKNGQQNQGRIDALKKALEGIDTQNARIVCVVDSPQTAALDLTLPKMPQNEMQEALRWKLKDKVPFSIDEAVLDYKILGSCKEKEVSKLKVRVAVSSENIVDEMLSLFESIGLKVDSIIPASIAVYNLIHNNGNMQNRGIAVLEMGELTTELFIYRDASLQFTRKLPVSGKEVTESLTSALVSQGGKVQLTLDEAERIKKEYGIPQSGSNELLLGKITSTQVLSLIRPKMEQLANEIERSFDYYREDQGGDVEEILLFGGAAKLKGLQQFLASELEKAVNIGNVLDYIETSSNGSIHQLNELHRFDVAIGAALHSEKGVNLIPMEIREKQKRLWKSIAFKATLIFICTFFSLIIFNIRFDINNNQKKIDVIQGKIDKLMPELNSLNQKVELNQRLTSNPFWEEVLKEVSNVVSVNMQLEEISMDKNRFSLRGMIHDEGRQNEIILSHFMQKLENGIFKNVRLIKSVKIKDDQEKIEFELNAHID